MHLKQYERCSHTRTHARARTHRHTHTHTHARAGGAGGARGVWGDKKRYRSAAAALPDEVDDDALLMYICRSRSCCADS